MLADEVVDDNYETGDWGFTQVDARNAFNELNRYRMLLTVKHLWPSGCSFYCFAAGAHLLSENELGHHSLSSQRQGSPRDFLFPCHFTDWLNCTLNANYTSTCDLLMTMALGLLSTIWKSTLSFLKFTVHSIGTHLNHINVS